MKIKTISYSHPLPNFIGPVIKIFSSLSSFLSPKTNCLCLSARENHLSHKKNLDKLVPTIEVHCRCGLFLRLSVSRQPSVVRMDGWVEIKVRLIFGGTRVALSSLLSVLVYKKTKCKQMVSGVRSPLFFLSVSPIRCFVFNFFPSLPLRKREREQERRERKEESAKNSEKEQEDFLSFSLPFFGVGGQRKKKIKGFVLQRQFSVLLYLPPPPFLQLSLLWQQSDFSSSFSPLPPSRGRENCFPTCQEPERKKEGMERRSRSRKNSEKDEEGFLGSNFKTSHDMKMSFATTKANPIDRVQRKTVVMQLQYRKGRGDDRERRERRGGQERGAERHY